MKKLLLMMLIFTLSFSLFGCRTPPSQEIQNSIRPVAFQILQDNFEEEYEIKNMLDDTQLCCMFGERVEDKDPNYFHVYVYPKRKPNVVSDLDIRFVNGEYMLGSELSLYSIWSDLLQSDAEDDYMEKIKAFYTEDKTRITFRLTLYESKINPEGKYWLYQDYVSREGRNNIRPDIIMTRYIQPKTIEQEYQTLLELLRSLYADKYYWGILRVEYINDSTNNPIHEPIRISTDDMLNLHSAKDIEKLLFQSPSRNSVPPVKEQ
ncbi:hypothetical protein [Paenibacillus sp. y28]|uniref:hypothetical protein n=1 Tax=Paenibacillus sp. y28 TaxID=3129110 RepID=UPI003016C353